MVIKFFFKIFKLIKLLFSKNFKLDKMVLGKKNKGMVFLKKFGKFKLFIIKFGINSNLLVSFNNWSWVMEEKLIKFWKSCTVKRVINLYLKYIVIFWD